jgi:hypothetical protein
MLLAIAGKKGKKVAQKSVRLGEDGRRHGSLYRERPSNFEA